MKEERSNCSASITAIQLRHASQLDIRQSISHNIQRGDPDLSILVLLHDEVISTCRLHIHLTVTSGRTKSPLQVHKVADQLHLTYGSEVPPSSLGQELADLLIDLGMAMEDRIVWLVHNCILGVGLRDDTIALGAVAFAEDAEEIVVSELVSSGRSDDCGMGGHLEESI